MIIISDIIIIFLALLIFFGIISKFHIFHFIIVFTYFYNYSHSSLFNDHGIFNFIAIVVSLGLFLIILFLLKVFFYITSANFIHKFKLSLKDPLNCDDWPKGLNNTYIENDVTKYGCQIIFPRKCYINILKYTQDINKLGHISCSNKYNGARKKILKFSNSSYINENTLKIGFPLTNNENGGRKEKYNTAIKEYSSKNLIDMDNPPSGIPKPEYIVDFSKDPSGELIIKFLDSI